MRLAKLLAFTSLLLPCSLAQAGTITESILVHAERPNLDGTILSFDLSYLLTFDPSLSYTDATDGLTLVSATSVNGTQYLATFHVPTGFNYAPNSYLDIGGLPLGVIGGNLFTDDFLVEIGLTTLVLSHPTQVFSPPRIIAIDIASANPSLGGGFGLLAAGGGSPPGTSVRITQVGSSAVAPEPSTLVLLATGLIGGVAAQYRGMRRKQGLS